MSEDRLEKYLQVALNCSRQASRLLIEGVHRPLEIQFKGEVDLVTRIDRESEDLITGILRGSFPEHDIVAEEGTRDRHGSEYVWYVDPIDGTTNYAHKVPWYAVSIALHHMGRPMVAVVENPATGQVFHAVKGQGAFLNMGKIQVSRKEKLSESLLVTGFPYAKRVRNHDIITLVGDFLAAGQGIRRTGAASLDLCHIALGVFDGYWEEGLKPWDTAAGVLLVEEAGGRVSDYRGEPHDIFGRSIVASNGRIHWEMLDVIKKRSLEMENGLF